MTTTYHTPYSTGGALTAAAMTAPLGQLDAFLGYAYQFVNIKEHGALVDGTTDDSVAINAAITAVNAAGGGIVFFPRGTCIVGGAAIVTLKSNVILRGTGYGSVLKLKASTIADVVKSAATTSGTAITYAGIEYLRIDGNKANQTTGNDNQNYGISLLGANDCWVKNVWVHDTKRSAIYLAGQRNRVTDCHITNIGTTGLVGSTVVGRSGIVFDEFATDVLMPIGSVCQGNEIVTTLEHGIKVYKGNGSAVTGNVITGTGYAGIWMQDHDGSSVVGNTIRSSGGIGIIFGNNIIGNHNICSGNAISAIASNANAGGVGLSIDNQAGATVSGNTVTGCAGNGIYVKSSSRTTVVGNTCHGNGTGGGAGSSGIMLYQSSDNTIVGNVCSNTGTTGVRGNGILLWDVGTACLDNVIANNRCFDTGAGAAKVQGYGINTADLSNYNTVTHNALRGNYTGTHTLVGANNVYTAGVV